MLDEADEMLDMGFIDDITRILKETPETRQTLLFLGDAAGRGLEDIQALHEKSGEDKDTDLDPYGPED